MTTRDAITEAIHGSDDDAPPHGIERPAVEPPDDDPVPAAVDTEIDAEALTQPLSERDHAEFSSDMTRRALNSCETELTRLREYRDGPLADRIRALVAQRDVLRSAAHAFDRYTATDRTDDDTEPSFVGPET